MFTCKGLRNAVFSSAILLGLGVILEIVVQTSTLDNASVVPALLSAIAASSVLLAGVLLAVTFVVSLLPRVSRRLEECQH
jgi:hypothetical protein